MRQKYCKKGLAIFRFFIQLASNAVAKKTEATHPKQPGTREQAGRTDRDRRPFFIANIPYQIEADWDSDFGPRLAGFPLNLMYTGVRGNGRDGGVESCSYWFDPGSYAQSSDKREMTYLPRVKSPYRVKVEYHKNGNFWRTLKYKSEILIVEAQGVDFEGAMVQTTLCGLQPDEPTD